VTTIFTIVDWYLPGFRAGGPVRSISNLISALGQREYAFFVLTRDRDFRARAPFSDVVQEAWTKMGNGHVFYTSNMSMSNLRRRIVEVAPDIIYLNSFFSRLTIKVLLLRRLGLLSHAAVVLAPRGEFSSSALALKRLKKKSFMALAVLMGLYRDVLWHASAEREKLEMQRVFTSYPLNSRGRIGIAPPIYVASDIPDPIPDRLSSDSRPDKRPGKVSFVFISRVSPMKNLVTAIELASALRGEVVFDIYGPTEDQQYFARCRQAMAKAPAHVKIHYLGALPHERARQKFSEYHFFLFPTLGENFGHVIVESLASGCPVIISDLTPWQGLEAQNAGWTLPLEDRDAWRKVLQLCVDMDDERFDQASAAARRFVREAARSPAVRAQNVNLFRYALEAWEPRTKENAIPASQE